MDGIASKALKCTRDNILWAIAHIFNLSLSNGEFIDVFKVAKVEPVFKKGSTYDVDNCRPISLLPVLSKILEKLVYKRLVSFLTGIGFFHKNQFGFRKNFSTSHGTTLLVKNITTTRAGLSFLWAWGYLIIRGIFFILFFEEKSNHN